MTSVTKTPRRRAGVRERMIDPAGLKKAGEKGYRFQAS